MEPVPAPALTYPPLDPVPAQDLAGTAVVLSPRATSILKSTVMLAALSGFGALGIYLLTISVAAASPPGIAFSLLWISLILSRAWRITFRIADRLEFADGLLQWRYHLSFGVMRASSAGTVSAIEYVAR